MFLISVSDIEGELRGFKNFLIVNKGLTKNGTWNFSKGHLVIYGDLFDRGKQVVELLRFLTEPESEVKKTGVMSILFLVTMTL